MLRSTALSIFIFAVMIGGLSVAGCSQNSKSPGHGDKVQAQSNSSPDGDANGQYVAVDGERVFVPSVYIDSRSRFMRPEKVARDILRGRKIIESGEAKTTFTTSPKGSEYAVSSIEFEPGEPQTLSEQIPYCRKRVEVFNKILRESGLPINDSVAGAGSAMLIAMKIMGRKDPLGESKRWQTKYQQHVLSSEAYQGRPDEEKQSVYEINAFFAVEGMNEMKKAKAARTAAEREKAQKKAKEYAEMLYVFLTKGWPGSTGS
jgi:hypothetical protein